MKKILKILLIISICLCIIYSSHNIAAFSEEISTGEINNETNVELLNSGSSNDEELISRTIKHINEHFFKKYGTSTWNVVNSNTTKTVSNSIPIDMQNEEFPKSDILEALEDSNSESEYGGCGPIAIIGIMDYFARYLGYNSIMNDPTSKVDRVLLATEVFNNVTTFEVNDTNATDTDTDTEKQTFSWPDDCINGFYNVMENHNLENTIVATDMGWFGVSKEDKIAKVKEQIDKGLPVSIYTLFAGDGNLSNHYSNVYGYEDYQITDSDGNIVNNTLFLIRNNIEDLSIDGTTGQPFTLRMDSDILDYTFTGVIYYDIKYDVQHLPSMLFTSFVNENNQGHYFNYEIEKEIESIDQFTINTKRLRCSLIESQYLVLSANYDTEDTAYLDIEVGENIKKIELFLNKWSLNEQFSANSTLKIQFYDDDTGLWNNEAIHNIDILSLPIKDAASKVCNFFVPQNTKRIRLIVENPNVVTDRNKGRIVIDCISLYFDNDNVLDDDNHIHYFTESYQIETSTTHKAYCKCGQYQSQTHIMTEEDSTGASDCMLCGYHISGEPAHSHYYGESYKPYSLTEHWAYCICGERTLKNHVVQVSAFDDVSRCIMCNSIVDLGTEVLSINSSKIQFVTSNGSYILPNGVIVIVDADLQALYAGNLVFYRKNEDIM